MKKKGGEGGKDFIAIFRDLNQLSKGGVA